MKRILSLALLAVMLVTFALSFVACGEKAECSICGEEYAVKKMHEVTEFDETYYVCEECYHALEDAFG